MNCIFCKIIKGELPSYKLAENERFLAIMDIYPVSQGHALIIPKSHCVGLLDMEEENAAGLLPFAAKVAKGIMEATGAQGFNMLQNNGEAAWQDVMHYHAHIIPRWERDGVAFPCRHKAGAPEELAALAKKIADRIKG